MPEIITNYDDFVFYSNNNPSALFWIIEYNPDSIMGEFERYSLIRNECLKYPEHFKDRLNNGIYRIWTVTPRDLSW